MTMAPVPCALLLVGSLFISFRGNAQALEPPSQNLDRDYRLVASILGYRGIGGDIDGIRNPLLQASRGETVRITLVNGEVLTHDIAMELHGVTSEPIVEEGAMASITFTAEQSDTYYCTVPGHRPAGMEGTFQLLEEADAVVAGRPVEKAGRALNLGFEDGSFQDWRVTGEAFGEQPVEGDLVLARTGELRSGHAGLFWASSAERAGYQATGVLTSSSFEDAASLLIEDAEEHRPGM